MKIGITGAGNIGGNLTRRLTALGHKVSVANSRNPDTLAEPAAETGATAVLATEAAVVVVTIPMKAVPDLPSGLLDGAADDVVVIDTCNYFRQQCDGRIALPVAGDDADAKDVAMGLVDSLGFDPIDGGGLDDSWRQQPGTPVYGANLDADAARKALAEASPERGPDWRA
jgi:hypothetical protein